MKAEIFNIQKFSLHDGKGIRTSVFFSRCNLKCKWCANPDCMLKSNIYTEQQLLKEVIKDKPFYDKSGGGVTLTGGEIFMQFEFIKSFAGLLHENKINIAVETAGNVSTDKFKELLGFADFIYMDMKHYSSAEHKWGTGAGNEQIIENLKLLAVSDKEYTVRIPVIPEFNDSLSDAEGFCRLFKECNIKRIELLPFHQLGEGKYEKNNIPYAYAGVDAVKKEDLADYKNIFVNNGFDIILN